jgi:hypothetical protein
MTWKIFGVLAIGVLFGAVIKAAHAQGLAGGGLTGGGGSGGSDACTNQACTVDTLSATGNQVLFDGTAQALILTDTSAANATSTNPAWKAKVRTALDATDAVWGYFDAADNLLWHVRYDGWVGVPSGARFCFDGTATCSRSIRFDSGTGTVRIDGSLRSDGAANFQVGATNVGNLDQQGLMKNDAAGEPLEASDAQGFRNVPQAALPTCGAGLEATQVTITGAAGEATRVCVCSYDGTNYEWINLLVPGTRSGDTTTCPASGGH